MKTYHVESVDKHDTLKNVMDLVGSNVLDEIFAKFVGSGHYDK